MMRLVVLALLLLLSSSSLALSSPSSSSSVGGSSSMPPLSPLSSSNEAIMKLAQKAMRYFDESPDPFHAVQTSIQMLELVGFQPLNEPFGGGNVKPGGKYYFTRNKSTLVAFTVGSEYQPGLGGFKIIGGHTDSPNLKIKPRSKRKSGECIQLGVECYGGGLWHTWFDRDLGVSGRILVAAEDHKVTQKLIKLDRAILRVPNLAIHLQTQDERKAFKVNKEDHLSPILAMQAKAALTGESPTSDDDDEDDKDKGGEEGSSSAKKDAKQKKDGWTEHQEPLLLQIIAEELKIDAKDILDFELNLFDVQKAALGGARSEFIHSARLDNLASCFIAVEALAGHSPEGDSDISLVALFDHEEVGSSSAVGAGSPIIGQSVERIAAALNNGDGNPDLYQMTLQKSFCLSVDQAHAIHPNYASKHEKNHAPQMNQGMVIKRNSNQRYATNGITGFLIRQVARRAGLGQEIQEFVVRNDCACGSTIGPIISSQTGIRAIDMGCPQWSMHSIRETMGVADLTHGLALFRAFFQHFREVDDSVEQ